MSTAPIPTGKIRGSLSDVTHKVQNFVGAVKVTTSSGKGGILVNMGRPVAAYLAHGGVLSRGKDSLAILEKENLAEFEIIRYDEEQFREAMIICENRGLLLEGEKVPSAGEPAQTREAKPREEENVLSAMMKRFAAPKVGKPEPVRPVMAEPVKPAPGIVKEEPLPPSQPPVAAEKKITAPEERETLPSRSPSPSPSPVAETELSSIIKRLRETGRIEKVPAPPVSAAGEAPPKPGVFGAGAAAGGAGPAAVEEPGPAVPGAGSAGIPEGRAPEERVRVDVGRMMKRIKRLDITSIRRELQEGEEELGPPGGSPGAVSGQPEETVTLSPAPAGETTPEPEAKGRSDIDELKAFIKRLEVLDEPREPLPPVKDALPKIGAKPLAAESPALPLKRAPEPVPEKEGVREPVSATAEQAEPVPKPPEEKVIRPVEPERKARIASLLRRSGLVKPPAEKEPEEPAPAIMEMPAIPEEKVKPPSPAPAPAEEVELRIPKPQRKRVEITRVPKKPERPLKEPPLIDEKMIQRILKQPGVIAVSTFYKGFAAQSAGRADFEQVAANAEDLFRAGKKIAREIDIGPLNQIILETGRGKLIIAPHGDLNVCIFTDPDANLGLIRVALKGLMAEKD